MSTKGFRERILNVVADGSALANSTSATSLLPSQYRTAAFPIGYFDNSDSLVIAQFSGRISTVATTPGTLQLDFKLGSTVVFSSGAMPLNTTAQTNTHWVLDFELNTRTFGASTATTLFPKGGKFSSYAVIGSPAPSAGGAGTHLLPFNAVPAAGSGFDNGAVQLIDLVATWSTASASNSITLHAGSVEVYT